MVEVADLNDGKVLETHVGQELPYTWEVYQQYLRPGMHAVVMGPGASIAYDASFLTAAWLLGKDGLITVVDPKGPSPVVRVDPTVKGPVKGSGDALFHISQLQFLRANGMNIAETGWAGPQGTIASTTLPDMFCPVIMDHNTSPFVTVSDNRKERIYWLEKTYAEFHRILEPQGVVLLQTNAKRYKFGTGRGKISLNEILRGAGFNVTHIQVNDIFHIPLTAEEADVLRSVPIETEVFDSIQRNIRQDDKGVWYFERRARETQFVNSHESQDMYICQRV